MNGTDFSGGSGPADPGTTGAGNPRPARGPEHWWANRPRRSERDRKVAGVAGGIARTLRVDPILLRIAFVVLAFFGGSGILLYALAWLLLPSDSDEVSAGEALLGRGRSSTSPAVAVCLSIVVIVGALSTFSPWGLPFIPALAIAIVIGVLLLKHQGRSWTPEQQQEFADRISRGVNDLSDRASRIGSGWGTSSTSSTAGTAGTAADSSPFDQPAFWERDGRGGWRQGGGATSAGAFTGTPAGHPTAQPTGNPSGPVADLSKPHGGPADGPVDGPTEDAPRTSPPSWDPLGVAPFAWDLPEPTPVSQPAPPAPVEHGRNLLGRVTIGLALLTGGLATAGIFAGWWTLSWAAVSAMALAVIGLGLLAAAFRGRTAHLIGPGIFLALVTTALTITGISGTTGFGQQTWTPATVAEVQEDYLLNGGQGILDLSTLKVPAGQEVSTSVEVRAGNAQVILPAGTNVELTCSANAGEVDCLGSVNSGLRTEVSKSVDSFSDAGTLVLDVHVGAGAAQVTQHG